MAINRVEALRLSLARIEVLRHVPTWHEYNTNDVRYRMPMAIAILSVVFQEFPLWINKTYTGIVPNSSAAYVFALALLISAALSLSGSTYRVAISIFVFVAATAMLPDWTIIANHSYLAIWCISPAVLFKEGWRSKEYMNYLRITFGLVMLAAFAQKILAGTYVDGSYLTHLSFRGATTEGMFGIFCDAKPVEPCNAIRLISLFILAWQLFVGALLLIGVRSIVFLMIEIGFLLGAGVYADEMNFQVLNIALLCIVFGYGMPRWLLATCITFLVIDVFTISKIIDAVI